MTTDPPRQPSSSAPRDVANLGLVRPPLIYLISILSGTLIQLAVPLRLLPVTIALPLGATLVAVAIGLFSYSVARFRAAGTPLPARKPTTAIVRTGPYRVSRNPIYLAFFSLHLGLAICVNSLWPVATLIATVAIIAVVVVPREERYLTGRFGTEYLEYRASVRRWL